MTNAKRYGMVRVTQRFFLGFCLVLAANLAHPTNTCGEEHDRPTPKTLMDLAKVLKKHDAGWTSSQVAFEKLLEIERREWEDATHVSLLPKNLSTCRRTMHVRCTLDGVTAVDMYVGLNRSDTVEKERIERIVLWNYPIDGLHLTVESNGNRSLN